MELYLYSLHAFKVDIRTNFINLCINISGSIPGGVTVDFFHGAPDRTMCPEVDSASESEYQGFLLR